MAYSHLNNAPIVVTIKEDVVNNAIICRNSQHAEAVLTREGDSHGVTGTPDDRDNGYIGIANGAICITWPQPDEA